MRIVVDVSMHYYGFCIYFSVTIWDCMDIVDYAGHYIGCDVRCGCILLLG